MLPDFRKVLERLPYGLRTTLGDGGALVSGGEGQRVRLGRAMLRPGVRLVILDEPFRGLDREGRRVLMARVRELWRDATLICITHDVSETRSFGRVLVVDEGRIVEDGDPAELAEQLGSRYGKLLDAEETVRAGLWSSSDWRQLHIDDGRLLEESRPLPIARRPWERTVNHGPGTTNYGQRTTDNGRRTPEHA